MRRLDHLVVAVRDLEAAADFYRRLGFQVGARNRHPWGTENRLIQFPGSFIELITVGSGDVPPARPGDFSFGAFVRDYLGLREGLAMLVLDSADAAADARSFADAGIGAFPPFRFERRGSRPDGSETRVAFSLAFAKPLGVEGAGAEGTTPLAGFFVCQQHFPENFWNEAFQRHPNHALGLRAAALAAPEPSRHAAFLSAFTGAHAEEGGGVELSYRLNGSRLQVMTPDEAAEAYGSVEAELDRPAFVAFAVGVEDTGRQAAWLDAADIPYQHFGTRLVVPASAAFGVAVAFEES